MISCWLWEHGGNHLVKVTFRGIYLANLLTLNSEFVHGGADDTSLHKDPRGEDPIKKGPCIWSEMIACR